MNESPDLALFSSIFDCLAALLDYYYKDSPNNASVSYGATFKPIWGRIVSYNINGIVFGNWHKLVQHIST
jgi:hypothetical protein